MGDLEILQADAQAYSPSQRWGLWNWMALSSAGARLGTGETWGFVAGCRLEECWEWPLEMLRQELGLTDDTVLLDVLLPYLVILNVKAHMAFI